MKKFIQHLKDIVSELFGKIPKDITDDVQRAINVANFLKGLLSNPITAAILSSKLGTWAAGLDATIVDRLNKILPLLYDVKGCADLPDPNMRIACILNMVAIRTHEGQLKDLLAIASLYLRQLHPEMTISDADTAIQVMYKHQMESASTSPVA